MKTFLFIFGTRPEFIKVAPLIKEFEKNKEFKTITCFTGQHLDLVKPLLKLFEIKPDINLNIMKPNQTLSMMSCTLMKEMELVYQQTKPDYVIVQGDTTSAMISGLCAFYQKIKIIHLEAGLRTYNKYEPFPEEINRQLIGRLADIHFAPTDITYNNLLKEFTQGEIHLVGNTVVNSVYYILNSNFSKKLSISDVIIEYSNNFVDKNNVSSFLLNKELVLITSHRRESWGKPIENICDAVRNIACEYKNLVFIYLAHPNPFVLNTVNKLNDIDNVFILKSIPYQIMVNLINKSKFILTDSGGIQEEACILGKPTLVLRNTTERMEGVKIGTLKLVGTSTENIINEVKNMKNFKYEKSNIYGTKETCKNIIKILKEIC